MNKTALDEIITFCEKSAKKCDKINEEYMKGYCFALRLVSQHAKELKMPTEKPIIIKAFIAGMVTAGNSNDLIQKIEADIFYQKLFAKK